MQHFDALNLVCKLKIFLILDYSITDWMIAYQAFAILSVLAIAGAACCLGLSMMTKKGILLYSCVYVAHVCFYACCSDSAGVCGDVCDVSGVVKGCEVLCVVYLYSECDGYCAF